MALVKVFLTFRLTKKWIVLLYFLGLGFFLTAFLALKCTSNTIGVDKNASKPAKPKVRSRLFYDLAPILEPNCYLENNNT